LGEEKNILAKEKEPEKIHHEEHEQHEGGMEMETPASRQPAFARGLTVRKRSRK